MNVGHEDFPAMTVRLLASGMQLCLVCHKFTNIPLTHQQTPNCMDHIPKVAMFTNLRNTLEYNAALL
jgi:hypothetical protein